MTAPKPINDLSLPVELTSAATAKKSAIWWRLTLIIASLVLIAEIIWLSQSFWLTKTSVRQLVNPVLAPIGYTLRRPLLTEAWQIDRLAIQLNADDHRIWQGQAVLSHRADILQPWPPLKLTLRDWQGRTLATGTLQPHEYLPANLPKRYAANALIAFNEPVVIQFAVRLSAQADGMAAPVEQVELRAVRP